LNARLKLNQAYINGALLVAGLFAAIAESWVLFILLSAIFIGLSLHTGDIRPSSKARDSKPRISKTRKGSQRRRWIRRLHQRG